MNIPDVLNDGNIFAVVGASNDESKYGYKVYKFLKEKGFKVYPVNPNRDEVQGDKAYKSLIDLPEKPTVVNVITPPEISEQIVIDASNAGASVIWFQPGSENEVCISNALKEGLQVIHDECILVDGKHL